jgi:hypothetical protein
MITKRRNRLATQLEACTSGELSLQDDLVPNAARATELRANISILNRYIEEKERETQDSVPYRESSADHVDNREVETEGNEFQNVYQVYLPHLILNNKSRNVSQHLLH